MSILGWIFVAILLVIAVALGFAAFTPALDADDLDRDDSTDPEGWGEW